jgi:predicted aspartyl protease
LIAGSVTEEGIPTIEVRVGDQLWHSTIDTGFNGQLELPEQLRSHVNAQLVGRATSLLAANQRIEEDLYLVDFPFDGRVVRAQATFSNSTTLLIGTGLLTEYRLGIDFPARTVTLDRGN